MYDQVISKMEGQFNKVVDHVSSELGSIRTSRASAALVEDVSIEAYGSKMPLKQLATITVPEPRLIVVQPFDKSQIGAIEKSLSKADIGASPNSDGEVIRLSMPPLTEERREELAKVVGQKIEEGKVALRTGREEAWKEIKSLESSGKISEDDKYKAEEALNKKVAEYNNQIEEMGEKKKQAVREV